MYSQTNYLKAVLRIQEALDIIDPSQFEKDSIIQRFEFCVELGWKAMKEILEELGVNEVTPSGSVRSAAQARIIRDSSIWLEMLRARNIASHTYNQVNADKIVNDIKQEYFKHIVELKDYVQEHTANK
jgi:nucleotidyltransferase substrate binding protein (TIGR01987 family)